LGKQFLGAAQT